MVPKTKKTKTNLVLEQEPHELHHWGMSLVNSSGDRIVGIKEGMIASILMWFFKPRRRGVFAFYTRNIMFTGIISKTAKVQNVKAQKGGLRVEIENKLKRIKLGESISINGVCSTVVKTGKDFSFQYMPETLKLSNIGSLEKGDMANIEQSMRLGDRLDGHMVLGHVDGRGKIIKIMTEGDSRVLEIIIPTLPSRKVSARQGKGFMKFLVYKGSVAVEGVSLTVANVLKNSFLVKIIPYTLEHTNLGQKKKGDFVNLEFDILAKYTQNANKK